jgi:hypothetical protein
MATIESLQAENEALKAKIRDLEDRLARLERPQVMAIQGDNERIVDEIPRLHRTFANLSDDGYWDYWEPLANGKFKWNPRWIKFNE